MRRKVCKFFQTGAILSLFCLGGCGTTQIIASDAQARIWVDGEYIGQGQGVVGKRGFPGTARVQAKTPDGRMVVQPMKRSFEWTTGVFGIFTYGVCLLACWEYPSALFLHFPPVPASAAAGSAQLSVDPWLLPPTGWKAPPTAAAAETKQAVEVQPPDPSEGSSEGNSKHPNPPKP